MPSFTNDGDDDDDDDDDDDADDDNADVTDATTSLFTGGAEADLITMIFLKKYFPAKSRALFLLFLLLTNDFCDSKDKKASKLSLDEAKANIEW